MPHLASHVSVSHCDAAQGITLRNVIVSILFYKNLLKTDAVCAEGPLVAIICSYKEALCSKSESNRSKLVFVLRGVMSSFAFIY